MPRRKAPEPQWEEPEKRRSDFGTFKTTPTDWRCWPLVAQQRFVRYDTLATWIDLEHRPPTYSTEPRKKRKPGDPPGPGRGGKRTGLDWPLDFDKRLAAVARIVEQHWLKMGVAEWVQPFGRTPKWVRLTQLGLHTIGLSWPETPFPDTLKYYEHNEDRRCHDHCVNEVRCYLARGGANAPQHTWTSERVIQNRTPQPAPGQTLPHLADGYITLEKPGSWDIRDSDDMLISIPLHPGQKIAIEVELNRKSYPRLEKEVFPQLFQQYDYVWYFAEADAWRVLIEARLRYLKTDEQRSRLRIMKLPEHLPWLYEKRAMTPTSSGKPNLDETW
ncbi:MAG TPA: hypothetical protein VFV38_08820 [Ktedonobacteraceae bacterium]|nr:hypothetical protein [Ktedonobacteraceae bacterium]